MIQSMLSKLVAMNRWISYRWIGKLLSVDGVRGGDAVLRREINGFVDRNPGCDVLECGGVDRPLLRRGANYKYSGLDIERRPACDRLYDDFFEQSVELPISGSYDLICSNTLLEHVADNERAFIQIMGALKASGTTIHYVPSKWHPYSVLTRLVGNRLQRWLIGVVRPEHVSVTGYKAYYYQCSAAQLRRLLKRVGFGNVRIECFWDADDYFAAFFPAFAVVRVFNVLCRRFSIECFASGMVVMAWR
jgi:SAM-dependent methyltransferase